MTDQHPLKFLECVRRAVLSPRARLTLRLRSLSQNPLGPDAVRSLLNIVYGLSASPTKAGLHLGCVAASVCALLA